MEERVDVYYWFDYTCVIVPVKLSELPEGQRSDKHIINAASQLAAFDNHDVSNRSCEIVRAKISG